jgi:hypothetical protein
MSAIATRAVPNASTPVQFDRMWKRLRRRTMAPSRPALYPDQVGLLLFTLIAVGIGVYFFVRAVFA